MFPQMLMQRTSAILSAVMGGFGVFFAIYSSVSADVAAQAIILLGCACALSYFSQRQ